MQSLSSNAPLTGRVRICLELLRKQQVKNKHIVDVGATSGWLEQALSHDNTASLTGIEPNQKALAEARLSAHAARFLAGDASRIPLPDDSADIVTLFDVIEHVPPHTETNAIKEISRVLKPHGRLLLSTPNSHILTTLLDPAWYFGHRHYTPRYIKNLLTNNNFTVLSCEVRGGTACLLYLLWFYTAKWIFGSKNPSYNFLQRHDDASFDKKGFFEIFIIAEKNEKVS